MDIGFIGLGVMGAPMAGHLARAGHRLTVFDIDTDRAREVAGALGAEPAASPREVAARSEIVITMLPDGQVVREVGTGAHGLIEGLRPGSLLLDTSSAEPWLTRQTAADLAARGVTMVDAPVSAPERRRRCGRRTEPGARPCSCPRASPCRRGWPSRRGCRRARTRP